MLKQKKSNKKLSFIKKIETKKYQLSKITKLNINNQFFLA